MRVPLDPPPPPPPQIHAHAHAMLSNNAAQHHLFSNDITRPLGRDAPVSDVTSSCRFQRPEYRLTEMRVRRGKIKLRVAG